MDRFFPEVAAALTDAHAAADDKSPLSRAAEWKAAYKVLTHVPRVALHGAYLEDNAVASLRGHHGAVYTLAGWSRHRLRRADEEEDWQWRADDDSGSESPAAQRTPEAEPRIFWCVLLCSPATTGSSVH
jgi:hypothetical protein